MLTATLITSFLLEPRRACLFILVATYRALGIRGVHYLTTSFPALRLRRCLLTHGLILSTARTCIIPSTRRGRLLLPTGDRPPEVCLSRCPITDRSGTPSPTAGRHLTFGWASGTPAPGCPLFTVLLALLPCVLPLLLLLNLVKLLLARPLDHRLLSGAAPIRHTPTPQKFQIVVVDARLFFIFLLGFFFSLRSLLRGLFVASFLVFVFL